MGKDMKIIASITSGDASNLRTYLRSRRRECRSCYNRRKTGKEGEILDPGGQRDRENNYTLQERALVSSSNAENCALNICENPEEFIENEQEYQTLCVDLDCEKAIPIADKQVDDYVPMIEEHIKDKKKAPGSMAH